MTDNEKILTWLGWRNTGEVNMRNSPVFQHPDIHWKRRIADECQFLLSGPAVTAADDYLVLEKVRDLICSVRWEFERRLNDLWQGRLSLSSRAEAMDALVICYRPGDYAEAARPLWDKQ